MHSCCRINGLPPPISKSSASECALRFEQPSRHDQADLEDGSAVPASWSTGPLVRYGRLRIVEDLAVVQLDRHIHIRLEVSFTDRPVDDDAGADDVVKIAEAQGLFRSSEAVMIGDTLICRYPRLGDVLGSGCGSVLGVEAHTNPLEFGQNRACIDMVDIDLAEDHQGFFNSSYGLSEPTAMSVMAASAGQEQCRVALFVSITF